MFFRTTTPTLDLTGDFSYVDVKCVILGPTEYVKSPVVTFNWGICCDNEYPMMHEEKIEEKIHTQPSQLGLKWVGGEIYY